VSLSGEHLADLPNAALAVRAGLTALLDLPQGAGPTTDLFGDAPIGDSLADADEHVRRPLVSMMAALIIVFNAVL
jgi:hypothetical protein